MILLDTHVLVWAGTEPERLSAPATAAIRKARQEDGVAIAAMSLWELAALLTRGQIQAYGTVETAIRRLTEGVAIKPLTPEIAALAWQFTDPYPRDPADRLIGATARAEGLALVTSDERIRRSLLVKTVW